MKTGTLYYGDCLDWMKKWPSKAVDLIYLDPPFNSDAHYNILFGDEAGDAQYRAFDDTWCWDEAATERYERIHEREGLKYSKCITGLYQILGQCGMMAYLTYMAERLDEMRRLLKPTGSIYLHCDPTAGHYLKILMDNVFGYANFRNEIIWRIGWVSGYKTRKRGWIRNHDTILYYLASPAAAKRFNKEYLPYPDGYVRRDGNQPKGSGIPIEDTWNCSSADVLDSIMIKSFAKKTGFPTEKTLALLERIIKASSNPGELVLDPFCGCGTTIDAARRLKREFIGIDINSFAIDIIRNERLKDSSIPTDGMPLDIESARKLAKDNPHAFESWAITRIPGMVPNTKQVADGGVDGRGRIEYPPDNNVSQLVLAQVKSGKFRIDDLRAFAHVMTSNDAAMGVFITVDPVTSPAARKLALEGGHVTVNEYRYPRLQLWNIFDLFDKRMPEMPVMRDPWGRKDNITQGELAV